MTVAELSTARRFFAEEICFPVRPAQPRLVGAFAAVPRELFVGPGPWRVQNHQSAPGYWTTETAHAREVYHDVAIALDEARGLNNGPPGLYALLLAHLGLRAGERIAHLGAGTGYYSAVLAEMVGPGGCVTAVEIDAPRAAHARAALASWPQARVIEADGALAGYGPVDAILVSAGATHPLPAWLDALAIGGRPCVLNGRLRGAE